MDSSLVNFFCVLIVETSLAYTPDETAQVEFLSINLNTNQNLCKISNYKPFIFYKYVKEDVLYSFDLEDDMKYTSFLNFPSYLLLGNTCT